MATDAGDLAAVQKLLAEGTDVNLRDVHDWTALHYAAGNGDVALVTALLAAGAECDIANFERETPLRRAAMRYKHLSEALAITANGDSIAEETLAPHDEVIRLLLAAGANPVAIADLAPKE
ncbi:MAG: ankyrin repeat protein [Rhodothermales bacterium]|jgi:ankyrin repeat protein